MLWKKGYVVITNANTILYYADGLKKNYPNDAEEINKIKAEAYFFRALAHFDLVLCYAQPYGYTSDASHAGIPVATRLLSTKETIARSSVKDVYDQVIGDLNTALSILGDGKTTDAHYISGEACDALLARVYLYMEDYADALKYADKVISEVTLTSFSDYNAMFTGEKTGSEAIFRLSGYYAGSTLKSFYNYQSPVYYPSDSFLSLFPSGDVRKTLLLDPEGNKACMKYYDMTDNAVDDQYYDISVLRGSEMYLIRAEASCMQDNLKTAASDIRTIRGRALNVAADDVPLVYYTKADLMQEIKLEYRKELCFEGHRFFDLARWGDDIVRPSDTSSSMKELDYPDHRFALPIPLVEMEANAAMTQNEGY
jgi:tetratricopeptide (TPR) repeat protein